MACRLRSLQQGSLNVGNTQQNRLNLLALAIAEANSNPVGRGPNAGWAAWGIGFGGAGQCTGGAANYSGAGLWLNVYAVPGYTAPPGAYGDPNGYVSMTSGNFSGTLTVGGFGLGTATWRGYAAGTDAYGSISPAPSPINGSPLVGFCVPVSGASLDVILEGTLSQNAFTQVTFSDVDGTQGPFLTSNASTFQTSGGYSHWKWSSGVTGSFDSGDVYPITFSWN